MKSVYILEASDTIKADDWVRPLALTMSMNGHGDGVNFTSTYGGLPQNNLKWIPVRYVLGTCWIGRTVKEFTGTGYSAHHPAELRMEFLRGDVPKEHQFDYSGLTSIP